MSPLLYSSFHVPIKMYPEWKMERPFHTNITSYICIVIIIYFFIFFLLLCLSRKMKHFTWSKTCCTPTSTPPFKKKGLKFGCIQKIEINQLNFILFEIFCIIHALIFDLQISSLPFTLYFCHNENDTMIQIRQHSWGFQKQGDFFSPKMLNLI